MTNISIIVPLASREKAWQELLLDLERLPKNIELLFIITDSNQEKPVKTKHNIRWIMSSKKGRAQQLNMGAEIAHHEYLWFLHADSRFGSNTVSALLNSIKTSPDALHYFNLKFSENLLQIKLNNIGVWLRSHIFGSPFGDQGFCIRKNLFTKIGGYSETAAYGEDHLLVWAAKRHGIKLRCTESVLFTSARKYVENGWLSTTLRHQYLWYKQVIPQWLSYLKHKTTKAQ